MYYNFSVDISHIIYGMMDVKSNILFDDTISDIATNDTYGKVRLIRKCTQVLRICTRR